MSLVLVARAAGFRQRLSVGKIAISDHASGCGRGQAQEK
jgi:hypothetical protein